MNAVFARIFPWCLLCLVLCAACNAGGPAADGDTDTPAEQEAQPLSLPVEPAAPDPSLAMEDHSYLQEINHPLPEHPQVGALTALVTPPAGLSLPSPFLVGPRGLWLPDDDGILTLLAIPEGDDNLVDAETCGFITYLLGPSTLYQIDTRNAAPLAIATAAALPANATGLRLTCAQDAGETVYILTDHDLGLYDGQDAQWVTPDSPATALHEDGHFYLAGPGRLTAYTHLFATPAAAWSVTLSVGTPVAILDGVTLPEPLGLVVVGDEGIQAFDVSDSGAVEHPVDLFAKGRIPLANARAARTTSDGGFMVAAEGGAYRLTDRGRGPEWRVYVPDRWMPGKDVRDVREDPDGEGTPIFFATDQGLGYLTREMATVEDKMAAMVTRIELRHDRDGAVADSHLTTRGDLSTNIPWDSDNDGGWTCYWVISECMRHKLTHDAGARANFDKSLERMLSFRTLTGTDYFLARSVIRIEGCRLDDCDGPDDGEWFKSADEQWWVKANTSNDEVTSHMFMMGFAYDLCADDTQKAAITAHVDGIVGGLVDHGYQLIDPQDGQCTSYGQFDPYYVNTGLAGLTADGGRRSAQMIAALNLAHYLTGKQKYLDAKAELLATHHYGDNIAAIGDEETYPFCAGSGDCDELAFQAFLPLLRYEPDPALRVKWLQGWNRLYTHLKTQEDAFWEIANASFGGEAANLSNSMRWFQDYPVDLVRWTVRNEARQDAVKPPAYYLIKDRNADYRIRSDGHIFPADERPNIRHNTPQFSFTGGMDGLVEMDGGDALWAYWFGRYYGYIR